MQLDEHDAKRLAAAVILQAISDIEIVGNHHIAQAYHGEGPADLPAVRLVAIAQDALGWIMAHNIKPKPALLTVHGCCQLLGMPVSSVRAHARKHIDALALARRQAPSEYNQLVINAAWPAHLKAEARAEKKEARKLRKH
jgi:hypothetical protein